MKETNTIQIYWSMFKSQYRMERYKPYKLILTRLSSLGRKRKYNQILRPYTMSANYSRTCEKW